MTENSQTVDLTGVHKALYKVLCSFDELCAAHHINYTLHGGTLLGAVRYGDFIPWDDDLDIALTRANYVKLENAIRHDGHFEICCKDSWTPRFYCSYYSENAIDLFIFDLISEHRAVAKLKVNLLRFCQGMFRRHIDYSHYSPKHWPLLWITRVCGLPFPYKAKVAIYHFACSLFQGSKRKIHRANDSFKGVGEIFDKSTMEAYSTLPIREKAFQCSREYETFLITSYGPDYLVPPPENERKPQHRSSIGG